MNRYDYDEKNIAASLKKALNDNADVGVVKYLNDAREQKIAHGGADTEMYKGDALSKAAEDYIDTFSKKGIEKVYEARRKAQTENLKQSQFEADKAYDIGSKQIEKSSAEAKRLYLAKNARDKINMEDSLARLGLSRGAERVGDSGYSESARAKLLSDAAEGLRKLYIDEGAAKSELAEKVYKDKQAARDAYAANIDKAYEQQVDDENAYYNMRNNRLAESNRVSESERDFDFKQKTDARDFEHRKETDARDFEYKKETDTRDFEYTKEKDLSEAKARELERKVDTAIKTFEATGEIVSEEQANILGLPVGTKTSDMVKLIKENEISKQKADAEVKTMDFENAYTMFEGTGVITSEKQAEILGAPVGTKFWKYITDYIRANASATSASASYLGAEASKTNAFANVQQAATAMKNAATNEYKAQTDRFNAYADYMDNYYEHFGAGDMYDY